MLLPVAVSCIKTIILWTIEWRCDVIGSCGCGLPMDVFNGLTAMVGWGSMQTGTYYVCYVFLFFVFNFLFCILSDHN